MTCSQHYMLASYLLSSDSKVLKVSHFAIVGKHITFKVIRHLWSIPASSSYTCLPMHACSLSVLGHYLLESCFSSASRICFSHPHFSALLIISWLNFGFEKLFHQCPHSFLLPVFCHYNFSHYLTNFDLKIL